MRIYYAADYNDMCRKAAGLIIAQVVLCPDSVLGLATGSTPLGIYARLGEAYNSGDVDFSGVTTCNLDEYCGLSVDNPQSYHYYMEKNLFSKVNISGENTYVPNGCAKDIEEECKRYDSIISENGGVDLQLLGIGNNGHIGFNEPADAFSKGTYCVELQENTILANSRFFNNPEEVPGKAITMGIKTIMSAKKVVLAVNGGAKEAILDKALYGPITPAVPGSILQLHPDLTVIWSKT
ncbi:MAG: glucosamine-6-phosphate deaminase [Oscillospiraceae bacterium]|jgi:glucosamine-6-phosphate deaminase|nr:glucosamine-6-phosphate deaminase [Oscillospiraceae bacterium]